MTFMYAVVYGSEYEDVAYFSNLWKAISSLFLNTMNGNSDFMPFVTKFTLVDGVYERADDLYCQIDPKKYHTTLGKINKAEDDLDFQERVQIASSCLTDLPRLLQ